MLCRWLLLVVRLLMLFFFFKQKTAYEMRISDWSSRRVLFRSRPVLGELQRETPDLEPRKGGAVLLIGFDRLHAIDPALRYEEGADRQEGDHEQRQQQALARFPDQECGYRAATAERSEEHTSALQSLMRSPYAVLCFKKKNNITTLPEHDIHSLYIQHATNNQ